MIGCVKSPNPPVLLQDPDRVLCSALDGEARIDFSLMNAGSLETLPTPNTHSRGDNLPEVRADPEEGVVVLTLVSLAPEDSKTKNDNYLFNPTAVVKKTNQLGKNQTINLVKEVCSQLNHNVQLFKSHHWSNPVLVSKLKPVPPGSPGTKFQKTIKDIFIALIYLT